MSVVVTPDAHSAVLDELDVVSVVTDPRESVAAWRDTAADALVVDSIEYEFLDDIRAARDGTSAPIVLVTNETDVPGPADALLAPDADEHAARAAIQRARDARDYREIVTDLYEACQDREPGHPTDEIRRLREQADAAYRSLDDVPPSVLYSTDTTEQ